MQPNFDPTEDRKYTEDQARDLWREARRMAEAGNCDFSGWRFPRDPDMARDTGCFKGIAFTGLTKFTNARFLGAVDFKNTTFFGIVSFKNTRFHISTDFSDVVFLGATSFTEARFRGFAFFNNVKFEGPAYFIGARFCKPSIFLKVTFDQRADFLKATFKEDVLFIGLVFNSSVWFPLPPWLPCMTQPFRKHDTAARAYRMAKQVTQNHGDYRIAGKYHFAEQCATNSFEFKEGVEEGSPWKMGTTLAELFFARLLFGYGEKPQRPLFAAGVVILLWAIFFCHFGGIEPVKVNNIHLNQETVMNRVSPANPEVQSRSFGECLYFSIVTFTTLGYGDMHPTDYLGHRLLAGSEALLGVAIMALFIVSLARKYTR